MKYVIRVLRALAALIAAVWIYSAVANAIDGAWGGVVTALIFAAIFAGAAGWGVLWRLGTTGATNDV